MQRERELLWLFDLGLIWKVVDGALEVVAGALVLLVPARVFVRMVDFITAGEISGGRGDAIASSLRDAARGFSIQSHYFIAVYLMLHGAVKALLSLGIIRGYASAYPLFIAAIGIFGAYEAYRGITTGNLLLDAFAFFDTVLIFLTAHEYRVRGAARLVGEVY